MSMKESKNEIYRAVGHVEGWAGLAQYEIR